MTDYLDEEMKIMEEQSQDSSAAISAGVDINDPIKTLDLASLVSVSSDISLKETIDLMNEKGFGAVVIADEQQKATGIFTDRDILRRVVSKEGIDLSKEKLGDYMTKNPETLSADDPIAYALNKMSDGGYRHLPITVDGAAKYMLSVKDIVDQIAITYRKNVLNLPPNPKQVPSEYGG